MAASARIHVLGLGSIGTFVAHSLTEIPARPPVTLLLHRTSRVKDYIRNGTSLSLQTPDGRSIAHTGYDFEALHKSRWYPMDPYSHVAQSCMVSSQAPLDDIISNLVVCVKSTQTVAALQPLRHRLSPTSHIVFLQNGAGMIEDANTHLWPLPRSRPNYMTGVISHGVTLNKPFHVSHTGPAATAVGSVPREDSHVSQPPSPLLHMLPSAPRLNCRAHLWPTILQIQLEKLACNALSNPLCALADAVTAYLYSIPETCTALMQEISSVILALPELQGIEGVRHRFSAEALENTVMAIIGKNKATTTSMVWDMRRGNETEIRYINGYWARRGREVGVSTPMNDELVERIEAMTAARMREIRLQHAENVTRCGSDMVS